MQNKGAIRVFAILLGLVCLYQLSFTVATRMAESTYEEMSLTDQDEATLGICCLSPCVAHFLISLVITL